MKIYKAADRSKLYKMIWEYEKRREELRKKYGAWNKKLPKGYKEKVKRINDSLENWRKGIRDIDSRNNKIIALGNEVAYFTGFNVKGSASKRCGDLAKGIFCKWGMENKIPGVLLAEYMGNDAPMVASRQRMRFTRSFKSNQKNKDLWVRFKTHYEEKILSYKQLAKK